MGSIKRELSVGVFYFAIAKYSGIVISLLISAILARLLTPKEFGVVAIAVVIISFFSMFSDLGIGAAIIQNKQLLKNDLSSIFSFTVLLGLLLAIIFFFCSRAISVYYDNDLLFPICRLLSINLFFASANIVPSALLQKEKRFGFIALRTFAVQMVVGLSSCVAAYFGLGVYSLLVTPVLSSVILFFANYRQYPLDFKVRISLKPLKRIYAYSIYQFSFNFVNHFSSNVDKLLIGKYLGMGILGYYEKSYRLMMLPLSNVTNVITPVMHPVFSVYQNNCLLLSSYYLKIIRLLAFIGFPLSVYLFFSAEEIVLLVFGNQWLASVLPFKILALSVGFQMVLSSSSSIYQAANSTRGMFLCGLFSAMLNITGISIGVFVWRSVDVVAYCMVVVSFISFIQCYWYMYCKMFGAGFSSFFDVLLSPLLLTVLLIVFLYLLGLMKLEQSLFVSFITKSTLSIAIGFLYVQCTGAYDFKKIVRLFSILKK